MLIQFSSISTISILKDFKEKRSKKRRKKEGRKGKEGRRGKSKERRKGGKEEGREGGRQEGRKEEGREGENLFLVLLLSQVPPYHPLVPFLLRSLFLKEYCAHVPYFLLSTSSLASFTLPLNPKLY